MEIKLSFYFVSSVPSKSPGNFSVNAINYHHIRATWDQIDIPYRNGILTNYSVLYWKEDSNVTSVYQAGPNETIADIDNLEPWKTYSFKIAGETSVGLGVFTNVLTVQQIISGENTCMASVCLFTFVEQKN